jgi:hypothetical protein
MKLKFPIIIYHDDVLVVDNGEGMKAMGASFPDNKTMLCKESLLNHRPGWIIEADGKFRELKPTGKRREWARPLSFIWRFVLSEYEVIKSRSTTVGEIKTLSKDIVDKFPEAPIAADFRQLLNQYDDNVVLSEDILRDWPI